MFFCASNFTVCCAPFVVVVVVVVTPPLPRDGGIAEDHGAPESGKLPGPEVVEKQRVAKEQAAQRIRSWTVQSEMRGVLGRVSAGAAGRVLDSANPREVKT